jgi:hypothetical protein
VAAAGYDDVTVHGQAGATWYAQLVAPVAFKLPSGKVVERVLVRWCVNAGQRHAARTPGDRTVRAAVGGARPRLELEDRHRVDWLLPGQLLTRAAMVKDWHQVNTVYANVFLHGLLHHGSETGERSKPAAAANAGPGRAGHAYAH